MTRTLMVEDITLTVIKSDGNTGYRERKHDIREYQWWAFGTVPTEPAKWSYYEDQKHANEGAAGSDAAAEGGVIPGGRGGDASSSSLSSSSSYGSSSSLSSAKWFLDNKPDETPGDGGVGGGAAAAPAASSTTTGGEDDHDDDDDGDSPLSSPSPAEGVYEGVYVTRANVHLVRCGTHLSVWWAGSNGFGGGYELGVVDHVYPEVPWVRVTYTSTSLRYDVNLLDGGKCKIMMGLPPVHGPSPQGPLCSSPSAPTPGGSSSSWTSSSSSSSSATWARGADGQSKLQYKMAAPKFTKSETSLLEMAFHMLSVLRSQLKTAEAMLKALRPRAAGTGAGAGAGAVTVGFVLSSQ
jgi:hypothetical protein